MVIWFFRYRSRIDFLCHDFGMDNAHIFDRVTFFIKKSRKVPTLNTLFCLVIFSFNLVAYCTSRPMGSHKTTVSTTVHFLHHFFFLNRYKDNVFSPLKKHFSPTNEGEFYLVCGAMKGGRPGRQNPSCILVRCSKVALLEEGIWCTSRPAAPPAPYGTPRTTPPP